MSASPSLQGRVAVITGGGSGLGRAMAQIFLDRGARVVIASRKSDVLRCAVAELEERGEVEDIQTDVRDPEQVSRLVVSTVQWFGGINILVNNAAGNFLARALEVSPNGFRTVVEIGLLGTWRCSQAVARHMVTS